MFYHLQPPLEAEVRLPWRRNRGQVNPYMAKTRDFPEVLRRRYDFVEQSRPLRGQSVARVWL